MARSKKTIRVEEIIKMVNRKNIHSTCNEKVRDGWNDLLEEILYVTNNYNGFRYLQSQELGKTIEPDPSRVQY